MLLSENKEEPTDTLFEIVEQAKQQWESAVDALPELICIVQSNGRVLRTNLTIERWTGTPVTSVQGRDLHVLLHQECEGGCYFEDFWLPAVQKALADGPVKVEVYDRVLRRYLQIRVRQVGNRKKAADPSLVVLLSDITERYRMERAIRRHTKRLEVMNGISSSILSVKDPVEIADVVLHHCRELVPYNQACVLTYEAESDNLQLMTAYQELEEGRCPSETMAQLTIPLVDHPRINEMLTCDDLVQIPRLRELLADGLPIPIGSFLNIPLIVDQRLIGTMMLTAEESGVFKQSHQSVMREVAELLTVAMRQAWLRQRLEKSNEELQGLLRANHEQMQNVTHELRSPLALIKGYTEMLRDGLMGPLTKEQQDTLAILDTKGDQLLYMVQRLFTMQTIDRDSVHKELASTTTFLCDLVESWQVFAANKEMRLVIDTAPELPLLYADLDLLTQVISNLLDNAMKFSSAGGVITIGAYQERDDLVISIKDQGKGIPAEAQANIFNRFFQVDKGSTSARLGAGIGLSLCKVVVNAHGGKIWVESEGEGRGSTFFLSLPLRAVEQEPG